MCYDGPVLSISKIITLAVDMKLFIHIHIHIHIHRFSVDIHGYIHIHRLQMPFSIGLYVGLCTEYPQSADGFH